MIPKEPHDRLGLTKGHPIELRGRDGRIEIEPAAASERLIRCAGLPMAVAPEKLAPLTDERARGALERTQR
jgi:hypothetical protein